MRKRTAFDILSTHTYRMAFQEQAAVGKHLRHRPIQFLLFDVFTLAFQQSLHFGQWRKSIRRSYGPLQDVHGLLLGDPGLRRILKFFSLIGFHQFTPGQFRFLINIW